MEACDVPLKNGKNVFIKNHCLCTINYGIAKFLFLIMKKRLLDFVSVDAFVYV